MQELKKCENKKIPGNNTELNHLEKINRNIFIKLLMHSSNTDLTNSLIQIFMHSRIQ